MSFRLQRYSPDRHANTPIPKYTQSHVVTGEVPLTAIDFDPRSDELAVREIVPHRMPGTCPRFNELVAEAKDPPISGAAERQHLSIDCGAIATVSVSPTAYPVCLDKIDRLNLDPERIPAEWLTDPERYHQFYCPFTYLGAAVAQGTTRVEIAMTTDTNIGMRYDAV